MNRIISVKLNADQSRYWLELDDGRRLALSAAAYLEAGCSQDDWVDANDWQRLARSEEKAQMRKRALTILDYGDRTEAELRRRLQGDPELINELISELRSVQLVDDERFTERSVERHIRRGGWGKRRLTQDLKRSGVAHELVQRATASIDEQAEHSAALGWAHRQLRNGRLDDPAVVKRLYNGLIRRGFEHGVARSVIRELGQKNESKSRDDEITLLT
ncbi:MAG: regulatory protein RecX [Bacillota bacterium]